MKKFKERRITRTVDMTDVLILVCHKETGKTEELKLTVTGALTTDEEVDLYFTFNESLLGEDNKFVCVRELENYTCKYSIAESVFVKHAELVEGKNGGEAE